MASLRKITLSDLELFNHLFKNIYINTVADYFRLSNWKHIVLENCPLIDHDNYKPFLKLLEYTNSKGLLVMPVLIKGDYQSRNIKNYNCIDFDYLPEEEEFNKLVDKEYLNVTGGIVVSKCLSIAAFSDPDSDLLFLGFDHAINKRKSRRGFSRCKSAICI